MYCWAISPFWYLLFLMCNDAVNWRINCGFVHSYCCFISDFCPVVNFNYVSPPKFVQSQKVLLMSAACLSKFYKFLKLSNKQHMGSFYAQTCKTDCLQILYTFCKNWISVPNIVHQLTLSLRCKYCKIHSRSNFQDAINSIRRSAAASDCIASQWRQSSMTSFVLSPFADARTCL